MVGKSTRRLRGCGSRGGGKATLRKEDAPENPYPKKSVESKIFGQAVAWFYYPRGPFPDNSANETGAVPLERLMRTKQMRGIVEKNPEINEKEVARILQGPVASGPELFDIQKRGGRDGELFVKAKPHSYVQFLKGGTRKLKINASERRKSLIEAEKGLADAIDSVIESDMSTPDMWVFFDSIWDNVKRMYPDSDDIRYMTRTVENKEHRRNPLTALSTILRVMRDH